MRYLSLVVAAAFFMGCGDDTTSSSPDLASASADLSVPADLALLTCANVLSCAAACAHDDVACQQACVGEASTSARATFLGLSGCVVAACSTLDGGTGSCTSPTDASTACRSCLSSAAAAAMTAGGACHAEYAACAAG